MRRSLTRKIYKTDVIILQTAFIFSCSFSIFGWIHNNSHLHSNFPCIFILMLVAMGERETFILRWDNMCSDDHPCSSSNNLCPCSRPVIHACMWVITLDNKFQKKMFVSVTNMLLIYFFASMELEKGYKKLLGSSFQIMLPLWYITK